MPKTCPQCGNQQPDGNRFCSVCGVNIEQISAPPAVPQTTAPRMACPSCGAELRAGYRFCKKCGAQVTQGQGVVQQTQGAVQLPSQGVVQQPQGAVQLPTQGVVQQTQGAVQLPSQGVVQQSQGAVQLPSQGVVQQPQGAAQLPSQGVVQQPQGAVQLPSQGVVQQAQGAVQLPSQGAVQLPSQGVVQLPSQGVVQQTQGAVYSYGAQPAKRSLNYTGLRVALLAVCAVLVIVGITTIPGNIRERTSGESTVAQTSGSADNTADKDDKDDEDDDYPAAAESSGEEADYDRETAELRDEYEEVEERYEAGYYSRTEKEEQLREDMNWAHDQMNNWMYGDAEESEVSEE